MVEAAHEARISRHAVALRRVPRDLAKAHRAIDDELIAADN
jgi:hypothetical protein